MLERQAVSWRSEIKSEDAEYNCETEMNNVVNLDRNRENPPSNREDLQNQSKRR